MNKQLKRFLLTIGFMTRIPMNIDLGEVNEEDMHKGFVYYPVVGLVIGLIDTAVYLLVSLVLPEMIAILFAILANFCITGAFHIDGLCDTADGIYSARTRERMLEIMKDSRLGTNGALAMCFDFLFKIYGLGYIPSDYRWLMILMMPIAGKMAQGAIVYKAFYPRKEGIGIYVGTIDTQTLVGTILFGLVFMGIAFSYWGILMWAVLFAFAYWFRCYITKRIGGITGDIQGAGSELCEIMLLFLVLIILRFYGTPESIVDLVRMFL